MKKQKFYLYLGEDENNIVLNSLINFKNSLQQQGRCTDLVDDVILKVVTAPVKKIKAT